MTKSFSLTSILSVSFVPSVAKLVCVNSCKFVVCDPLLVARDSWLVLNQFARYVG